MYVVLYLVCEGRGAVTLNKGLSVGLLLPVDPTTHCQNTKPLNTTAELLPMVSPAQLVACDDPEAEAEHWAVFADVYEAEVAARTAGASGGKADGGKGGGGNGAQQQQQQQLSVDARRQILADILVWAEVSQARYDEAAAAFVTAPHESDDAFNRIGRALREARQARGLEPAR